MNKKEKAAAIVAALEKEYPAALCQLSYIKPHELLIATRLAAQCTDFRVNIVTKTLFEKYKSVADFAAANPGDIEKIIKSCGLFKTKARDIVNMCAKLMDEYGGAVPDSIEKLTALPGVGRKTANLIMGDIYKKPAVVCDTHCIRITNLLGLADSPNPLKVETQLREILDPQKSNDFCHRLVLHGRAVCAARRPRCGDCVLSGLCDFFQSEDRKSEKR
ncbi:MAG: endonuclease III [Oscillospiraceae bacterium]|nr:endonuclease III [Oscillospiraceae bacterium]